MLKIIYTQKDEKMYLKDKNEKLGKYKFIQIIFKNNTLREKKREREKISNNKVETSFTFSDVYDMHRVYLEPFQDV